MQSIDHFDLRSFDLNLLVAFDALVEEGSVTRAATRLKVRQPAMSHSLSTLRMLLDDALFVRVGTDMRATPRALELAPRIRAALREVQEAVRSGMRFDPLSEERTFRLGFCSEMEVLVLPALAARIRADAPRIRVIGRHCAAEDVHRFLDDGVVDCAVGGYGGGERHGALTLFEPALACCFNPLLLPLTIPVDEAAYLSTPHAVTTLRDELQGCIADALRRAGATLDTVVASSDFLSVLAVAEAAPILATLPAQLARRHAPRFGLVVSPIPLSLATTPITLLWSRRVDRDPAAIWLRNEITAALKPAATTPAKASPARSSFVRPAHTSPPSTTLDDGFADGLIAGRRSGQRDGLNGPDRVCEGQHGRAAP